jgi:hypothetical protein
MTASRAARAEEAASSQRELAPATQPVLVLVLVLGLVLGLEARWRWHARPEYRFAEYERESNGAGHAKRSRRRVPGP